MSRNKFVKDVMNCEEYLKALEDTQHPCHKLISRHGSRYICEPFLCEMPTHKVEVMFLGLSPGHPGRASPVKGKASLHEVIENSKKKPRKRYTSNYENAIKDRLPPPSYNYVKANIVHGIGSRQAAERAIEICGSKFLEPMISLFPNLKYVIIYDFDDEQGERVLDFVNKKMGFRLSFENATANKGLCKNGVVYIAARRTISQLRRLSKEDRYKAN